MDYSSLRYKNEEDLRKLDINIFDIKNNNGNTIFLCLEYSDEFKKRCRRATKYCPDCLCRKCEYHFK